MSTDASWRLLMNAFEPTPGEWWLRDANQLPYAIVKLLRRGDELGYRAVTYAERSADRELIGYYRRLAPAAVAAHERHIRSMTTPTRSARSATPSPIGKATSTSGSVP